MDPRASGWAALKNEKDTTLTAITLGSKYCSYVRSPAPSHTHILSNPFRTLAIKWEVNIFIKKSSCVFIIACICCSLRRYVSSIYMYISAWTCVWECNNCRSVDPYVVGIVSNGCNQSLLIYYAAFETSDRFNNATFNVDESSSLFFSWDV